MAGARTGTETNPKEIEPFQIARTSLSCSVLGVSCQYDELLTLQGRHSSGSKLGSNHVRHRRLEWKVDRSV